MVESNQTNIDVAEPKRMADRFKCQITASTVKRGKDESPNYKRIKLSIIIGDDSPGLIKIIPADVRNIINAWWKGDAGFTKYTYETVTKPAVEIKLFIGIGGYHPFFERNVYLQKTARLRDISTGENQSLAWDVEFQLSMEDIDVQSCYNLDLMLGQAMDCVIKQVPQMEIPGANDD